MSLKFRGQTERTPIAVTMLSLAIAICLNLADQAAAQDSSAVRVSLGDTPLVNNVYYQASPTEHQTALPPVVQSDELQSAPIVSNPTLQNGIPPETSPDCVQCPPIQNATLEKKKPKANPCATSHKPVFFDNDFSYLLDDGYNGLCFGDSFKKIGPRRQLDIGGQIRFRYHHEQGMGQQAGQTRFENTTNDFLLNRLRMYADWKISDRLRLYTEGIYADVLTSNNEYIPRGIDQNFGDITNFFVDVKLIDDSIFRVGRQDLLFGAQRLISPLDWANTRRSFDAARMITTIGDWKVNLFYAEPVRVEPNEFDTSNLNRNLYGMYSTYSGMENSTWDVFAMGSRNSSGSNAKSFATLGSRVFGYKDKWLYELEGIAQTGNFLASGDNFEAYAWTAGLGRRFAGCWKPEFWLYYDYASGNSPGGSTDNFDELYPLGHKYLGFIDAVRRTNVKSPSALLKMSPTEKLGLLLWYQNYAAAERSDNITSFGGTPAQDPALADFGNELDIVATFKASARTNVLAGYSHFWAGDKILSSIDADFFYMQWQTNF